MAFRVELTRLAFDDLDLAAGYIRENSNRTIAEGWFNSVIADIASLREMPARCRIAPESREIGREVRVLLHGRRNRTYKIYFLIRHDTPTSGVVHVRHWARKPVSAFELLSRVRDI